MDTPFVEKGMVSILDEPLDLHKRGQIAVCRDLRTEQLVKTTNTREVGVCT